MTIKKITPTEAAKLKGCNRSRILRLLSERRIPGAEQLSNGQWLLPPNFKVTPAEKRKRKLSKLA